VTKKGGATTLPQPPNGLVFSSRERAAKIVQKTNDLAREAVGWNTVLGCTAHLPHLYGR
jgi:hypothetical protein